MKHVFHLLLAIGLVGGIYSTAQAQAPAMSYAYDAAGNRVKKYETVAKAKQFIFELFLEKF